MANAAERTQRLSPRQTIVIASLMLLIWSFGTSYYHLLDPKATGANCSTTSAEVPDEQRIASKMISNLSVSQELFKSFQLWIQRAGSLVEAIDTIDFPTLEQPFIFFHNRKAGGSSLRWIIWRKVKNMTDNVWIPCFGQVSCSDFADPPQRPRKSVYGSHVTYSRMRKTLTEKSKKKGTLENGINISFLHIEAAPKFDCLTNIRSTVSRVVSCYNFRFVDRKEKAALPPAQELSPRDWQYFLPLAYDGSGNGCNNEATRIFSEFGDDHEQEVNSLTIDSPGFQYHFETAASRLSKCVILDITERCEESNRVLAYFYPWLAGGVDLCSELRNRGKTTKKALSPGAEQVILEQNAMDELLYQFAATLFEEQLQIADHHIRN